MNLPAPVLARLRRALATGLSAALVGGLVLLGAPSAPAAGGDPIHQAPAVVETEPSDQADKDSVDDPAIWVDPDDPTRSVIIGADHADKGLSVYDLSGDRIQELSLSSANNVDLRTGFTLDGKTHPIVALAGSGDLSFYKFDQETRRLSNVTPGGPKIEGRDLKQEGDDDFVPHGVCLYHSPVDEHFYVFVVDRFGTIKQFELTDGGNGKVALREVREMEAEPRGTMGGDPDDALEGCVADEVGRSLFVGEQDWHIWRYGAEPTDPTGTGDRVMVDSDVSEGGHFVRDVEGLTLVNAPGGEGYLIASSQGDFTYTVYRSTAPYEFVRKVKVVSSGGVDGCERTDGIDAVAANLGPVFPQGIFVCQDNTNPQPNGENRMNFKYVRLESVLPLGSGPNPQPPTTKPPTTTTQPTTTQPPTTQPPTTQPPTTQPPTTQPPTTQPPTTRPPITQPQPPVTPAGDSAPQTGSSAAASGYWMLGSGGKVFAFGEARSHGDPDAAVRAPTTAVDLEPVPAGTGYWVVDDRGVIYAYGTATTFGSLPAGRLAAGETVTSLSSTSTARGYWIFTSAGRVFAFGDATHRGDMAGTRLNGPVLDSITTPSGNGYYMVASDGGIFAFGDARYYGSMGGKPLNKPVQSLVPDPDGTGYWLVASDGGVFAFEAGFGGSMGGKPLNKPVTGMVPYGNGYLMVAEDGGIFNFSEATFAGSLGNNPPAEPITSVAALG